eukprot:9150792-Pyramimonas_sp.AAC.1
MIVVMGWQHSEGVSGCACCLMGRGSETDPNGHALVIETASVRTPQAKVVPRAWAVTAVSRTTALSLIRVLV